MGTVSLFLIFLVIGVYAISQGDVTLSTPSNATWTNATNYTAGYNFTWNDADDFSYEQANCSLFIGVESSVASLIKNETNYHTSVVANNNTLTRLYMNDYFMRNDTMYYWTVVCGNSTSQDGGGNWAPTPYVIYQDNSLPLIEDLGRRFTNDTWLTYNDPWFYINVTDSGNTHGSTFAVAIINASNASVSHGSTTTSNATAVNLSLSLSDGNYTVNLRATDPAGNFNKSTYTYDFQVDTTDPALTYQSDTIADGGNTTEVHFYINFSVTEAYLETINLTFDSTDYILVLANNCTSNNLPIWYCSYNVTGLSAENDIAYNFTINDTAGNLLTSATRTISVDTASPTIDNKWNWSVTDSVASWNFTFTDTTPDTCYAYVWNRSSDLVATKTGTINSTSSDCTGTFSQSDIAVEGAFTIEYYLRDEPANSVTGNLSGVMTNLYEDQWNLITYASFNQTVENICSGIEYCTNIAVYNNSAKTYTTYSTSTPTVNNDTMVNPGDAMIVYVSDDDYLIGNDHIPKNGNTNENITLYTGWNTMGLVYNTTMNTTIFYKQNGTMFNITWGSLYDADADTFYTCSRAANLCAGTSDTANNIMLPKGYAVWVMADNVTINRSVING